MKILKMYYERLKGNMPYNKAKEALYKFGDLLEKHGWINDIMEAGYVSPDLSTIFYYGRSPYNGQFVQFTAGTKANDKYKEIQERYSEYFVEV